MATQNGVMNYIDENGNETVMYPVTRQKNIIGINYLRPTLQTTTQNGVTCTNNGDGTYTLNGTSTNSGAIFKVDINDYIEYGKTYKVVGCPQGGGSGKYGLEFTDETVYGVNDSGNGVIFSPYETGYNFKMMIVIYSNQTVNNLVFKPMLTDDLSATYDDFVSFDDSLVTGINSGLKMDLLWTNASPTSDFSPQTLTFGVDLEKTYKYICIVCKSKTDSDFREMNFIKPDSQKYILHVVRDVLAWRYEAYCYSNVINIGDGLLGGANNQSVCIPVEIYGVK